MVHAVENMAFVGDVPWHGLGTSIDQDTPLADIQVAAGLDWEVRLEANHKLDGTPIEESHYIERVRRGRNAVCPYRWVAFRWSACLGNGDTERRLHA